MAVVKPIIAGKKIQLPIPNYAYTNREDLTQIVIPENVKMIGRGAFANCKNLKKVILPENLEYIGPSAFSNCENLVKITLPKNIKKLNYRTFGDCKRLKKIVIPEGVEELDWGIFAGCENLVEIVLPESLKKIEKQIFLNCKRLRTITLPSSITKLPDEFFRGCTKLDIVLNSNITELGNSVFEDCHHLSTFPKHVESFGENCFKNCRNIVSVNLNEHVKFLSDGLFDGCTNLLNINSSKQLNIGKRCFRNCKSLTDIPSFVKSFNEQSFENCTGLKRINVVGKEIPTACFRGCKNLIEVLNQDKIYSIGAFAFSGCENLEKFKIYHVHEVPAEAFSNCKKLKKIRLLAKIKTIGTRAFHNCQNLADINLPDSIERIKKEAFRNCSSIKTIYIPTNLKSYGDAAFYNMDSLECIEVSPRNKTYSTPDNKILIDNNQQKLVLYACNSKDKSYSLKNYNLQYDKSGNCLIVPINSIGEFAFAGAKNLEELTICACTQDIEETAFYGCENLKKLNVVAIPLFTCIGFRILDHGIYYDSRFSDSNVFLPFEEVSFSGELVSIFVDALQNFTNVKKLTLPEGNSFTISSHAFSDCSLLNEVIIPNGALSISKNAFNSATKLKFENGLQFKNFVELIHNTDYVGDYKLYVLENETYYIEQIGKDGKIVKITKDQIDNICSKSEAIKDNPVLFLDFINDLIKHDLALKQFFNGILMSTMSLENREIFFANLKKNDSFFLNILKNSKLLEEKDKNTETLLQGTNFSKVVAYVELLRKYNIDLPQLHSKFFMANLDIKDFEHLIKFDLDLFKKIIIEGKLLEDENKEANYYLTYEILQNNTLHDFINLVKKYNIKDKYLFSKPFIAVAKNPLMEDMIKIYDANIKRLLKASHSIENCSAASQNLNDLLILMKITGALEKDEIRRQKAATFITEKIFEEKLPNGNPNKFRIIGDDIHRIFNFSSIRKEFDQEFATFFLENYQELIEEEIIKSGFIQRVYTNFRQISKTCTSDKGSQRKLKVTMNKCRNYLSTIKFDNVTDENKEFAKLLGEWYDDNRVWINAQQIYSESLNAPRNIFTKVNVDENDKVVYDMNPDYDLKEDVNSDFSYQWLPKQDYYNLILGKYCGCCAHVNGAGQGIMRASMILDNCQNLVIRNNLGVIVSKSTIYVNKKQGYAVFNNVETSLNYKDEESREKIYNAFLRGSKAFLIAYNENNPEFPITNISIGINRNTILNFLEDENNHPEVPIQESLYFGSYSLSGSGYDGDWNTKQRLVLKT